MTFDLLIFTFKDLAFFVKFENSLDTFLNTKDFLLCFSIKVLCFKFKSVIHFVYIFAWGFRFGLRFMFLPVDVQLFHHHLLKKKKEIPPPLNCFCKKLVGYIYENYFQLVYSVPLICVSFTAPRPYHLDYLYNHLQIG